MKKLPLAFLSPLLALAVSAGASAGDPLQDALRQAAPLVARGRGISRGPAPQDASNGPHISLDLIKRLEDALKAQGTRTTDGPSVTLELRAPGQNGYSQLRAEWRKCRQKDGSFKRCDFDIAPLHLGFSYKDGDGSQGTKPEVNVEAALSENGHRDSIGLGFPKYSPAFENMNPFIEEAIKQLIAAPSGRKQ